MEWMMLLMPLVFNWLNEQRTAAEGDVYTDPQDIPLTSEDWDKISELGGPSLIGEESLGDIMQAAPEDFRPFIGATLQQQAAQNAINRDNYSNWVNLMNSGYEKSANTLGQLGPALI